MRLREFDEKERLKKANEKLNQYKTAAGADAAAADASGNFARGHTRFKGINRATKKQFANDAKLSQLKEFAPSGDDGDGFSEETLKRLAAQWWNNDEDPRVEQTLMAAGWEIGQDDGYDDGGVFVVQAGDDQGDSYLSWPAEELQMNEVAPPGDKAERMVRHIKQGYARDGKLTPKEKGIAFATAWKAHNAGRVEEDLSRRGFLKGAGAAATMAAAGPEIVTLVNGFAEKAGGLNGIQALKAMLKIATPDELYNMYDYYSDSGILEDAITQSDMIALDRAGYDDWSEFEEHCDENGVDPDDEFKRLTGRPLKVSRVDDILKKVDNTWSLEDFFEEYPDALKIINPFENGSISMPTLQQLGYIDTAAKGAHLPAPIVAMANAVSGLVRQIFKSNGQSLAAPQQTTAHPARHTPALPAPTRPEFDMTPDLKQKQKVPVQRKGDDEEPEDPSLAPEDPRKLLQRLRDAGAYSRGALQDIIDGTDKSGMMTKEKAQELLNKHYGPQKPSSSQNGNQGVAEGTGQKPTITYKDYTLQYDYQTEDDDPEGYSTATTYYFDVFKDGKRVGEAEYFDYFGNLTIRINGKTKEFGFRHPLASQISQLVSSLPDEQKKDLSDPKFESQGVAEGRLNELSKDTLKAYAKKAVPDMQASQNKSKAEYSKATSAKDDETANKHYDAAKQAKDRTEKRMAGVAGAIKRFNKEGVAEGSIKDVEAKIRIHDQRKADREQEGDPYVAHELHSHNVIRKQLLDKRKRAQAAYHKKMDSEGADEGQQIDEVFADQGSGSTDRDNADYMKRRNAAKKAGYTGRETKAGTWRVFKDGNAVAVAGPFKSREEASAWIKKHKQGVTEMDKSEPSAGRDTGPRPGPDREAKPIAAKKATKDAADMLNRAFQDSHKKKDVKEVQLDEFARGEGGYGPFKIYIGHHFTDQQFSTFGAAKEAVGILQNNDPALADGDWRIVNGTGKTVWEHVPAYDDMDESLAEDSLAAMRRLAGIVPQVPAVVSNGPRQYRHMPTAVQPR